MFSNTLSFLSSRNVSDQVSHPNRCNMWVYLLLMFNSVNTIFLEHRYHKHIKTLLRMLPAFPFSEYILPQLLYFP
jgi:hypothetical protein